MVRVLFLVKDVLASGGARMTNPEDRQPGESWIHKLPNWWGVAAAIAAVFVFQGGSNAQTISNTSSISKLWVRIGQFERDLAGVAPDVSQIKAHQTDNEARLERIENKIDYLLERKPSQ